METEIVLITGTSKGIGLAAAVAYAREGKTVIATMRDPEGAPKLGEIASREGLPIHIRQLDVNSGASVEECFKTVYDEFGKIDILVNNAGIERHGSIEEMPIEEFKAVMDTNYFGVIRCVKQVMPHMRQGKSGCIINISSVAGIISYPPLGPYSASKYALEAISEHMAVEGKPLNIDVYVVQPGIIDTPMARGVSTDHSTLYPYARRMAALFEASLQNPVSADVVAAKLLWISETRPATFRHPVGPDAEPYIGWRTSLTHEEWINWHSVDDETWMDQVMNSFGMDVRSILSSDDYPA